MGVTGDAPPVAKTKVRGHSDAYALTHGGLPDVDADATATDI